MNTQRSSPDPPATIDILLLRTLSEKETFSSSELSAIWGEDETRVKDWLVRFEKQGLVNRLFKGLLYAGNIKAIADYLESRKLKNIQDS
jgi:hypothetical protein